MSQTPTPDVAPAAGFRREVHLFDATMLVVGSMIGSGVFIVSADIARTVGGAGWVLAVWLITGVVTLVAALSYGELAAMMPHAGGQYVYLQAAWGPLTGFLYGWTLFLVIQTGTIAAVAVAFAKFTAVLLPAAGEDRVLLQVGAVKLTAARLVAIAVVWLLTLVNLRGIREGKIVQNLFTAAKVLALAGLVLLLFTHGRNPAAIGANWDRFWEAARTQAAAGGAVETFPLAGLAVLAAVGVAMVGSLFSSDAWHNVTFIADEVVNPRKTLPLSLALGVAIVTVLYFLANVAYLVALPVFGSPTAADAAGRGVQFAAADRVATAAVQTLFGAPAAAVLAALVMVSTFGCNNGLILSGARVYYAMARDGLFFRAAGALSDRGVPATALAAQAVWTSALCLSGTYGDLLDYVIFAVLIFYALSVAGIFVLRRTRPDAERPYRAWGYPVLPGLYVLAAVAICVDLLIFKPAYTWPGLGIVAAGVPIYFLRKRAAGRQPLLPGPGQPK